MSEKKTLIPIGIYDPDGLNINPLTNKPYQNLYSNINKTIDVFRLTLHPTEKSLGGLSPGDEVPNSNSEKVIHKKDGTIWEKSYGRGSMRYIRDCCIDSNIKKLKILNNFQI